ncbi:energy transducer TonB, partial [Acetobacter thailandicus]|nr:energy transducer TonB [Acetobacter thailandicus]
MQDLAQQQHKPVSRAIGAGAVVGVIALIITVLLHIFAVTGLIWGMGATTSVPVPKPPVKTRIVEPPPPPP